MKERDSKEDKEDLVGAGTNEEDPSSFIARKSKRIIRNEAASDGDVWHEHLIVVQNPVEPRRRRPCKIYFYNMPCSTRIHLFMMSNYIHLLMLSNFIHLLMLSNYTSFVQLSKILSNQKSCSYEVSFRANKQVKEYGMNRLQVLQPSYTFRMKRSKWHCFKWLIFKSYRSLKMLTSTNPR